MPGAACASPGEDPASPRRFTRGGGAACRVAVTWLARAGAGARWLLNWRRCSLQSLADAVSLRKSRAGDRDRPAGAVIAADAGFPARVEIVLRQPAAEIAVDGPLRLLGADAARRPAARSPPRSRPTVPGPSSLTT